MIKKFKFYFLSLVFLPFWACASNSIFTDIPLSIDPLILSAPISMAIDAGNNRAYLVSSNNKVIYGDGSLTVLDITDPTQPSALRVISLPSFSGQVILDTDRSRLYIPNRLSSDDKDDSDQIARVNIDESSADFMELEFFASGADPFGGAYDGIDAIFVAGTNQVFRYNADNMSTFSQVDLNFSTSAGNSPDNTGTRELALGPSTENIYVTNRTDNLVILRKDEFTAPDPLTDILALGQSPVEYVITGLSSTRGIAVDSTNNDIYVVSGSPSLLSILDDSALDDIDASVDELQASTLLKGSLTLGDDPNEIVLDATSRLAYVSNLESDDISVVDMDQLIELKRISVSENLPAGVDAGEEPFGLALANIGGTVYLFVTNLQSNNVSVIDTSSLSVVASFP